MKHRGIEEQTDRLVESLRVGGKHAIQGIITSIPFYLFISILS